MQTLKGTCREFEAECVWGYLGWQLPNISHLRLGFYTSDIFAPEPTHQRDVAPILALLQKLDPDVVTVALDPEASGPDTHYKVLQAVTAFPVTMISTQIFTQCRLCRAVSNDAPGRDVVQPFLDGPGDECFSSHSPIPRANP